MSKLIEIEDVFTGEVRKVRESRNHYEENDGKPVAPHVDIRRPTVRERVENLLMRGIDPLAHYIGTEGMDMEVPDDPDAPLTPSEANYLDAMAESLAEQAPLPDDGMPRPASAEPAGATSSEVLGGAGGSSPPAGAPSGAVQPAPSTGAGKSVPT